MTSSIGENALRPGGAPVSRAIVTGPDWRVSEYTCTAGPAERPFEERHDHVTIAAVVEGSFTYATDTGRALLHPGAFLLGNAGRCYECGHDHSRGDRCVSFHFSPGYFAEVAASIAGSSRFTFPVATLPALRDLLPWLVRIEARAARAENLEIDEWAPALMEAVIGTVSRAGPTRIRVSARDERRLKDALRHIELHADEPLDLAALAGVACMSKYHFLRLFRGLVGMTPYQFLLSVRMRRAALRLATSVEPVATIAFDVGFGDLSTFNTRFRDIFGVSPRAFRRRERTG